MTNKEIVLGVIKEHPCVTGAQIHNYALRMFKENITPQAAASIMRAYEAKMVYWLTDHGKEELL